jgi:hypothetical protein
MLIAAALLLGEVHGEAHNVSWVWEGGSMDANQAGVFGVVGVPNASNEPGARHNAVSWVDANRNRAYVFGGNRNRDLNDLWYHDMNAAVGEGWVWAGGGKLGLQYGSYGVMGVPNASNFPGARRGAVSWVDASKNRAYIFGGYGNSALAKDRFLHDLWYFNMDTEEWVWAGGPDNSLLYASYGTTGVRSSSNFPGARKNAVSWVDVNKNRAYIFGGQGYGDESKDSGLIILGDLWYHDMNAPAGEGWVWAGGSNFGGQEGSQGVTSTPDMPGARAGASSWVDAVRHRAYIFGGTDNEHPNRVRNDLWYFDMEREEWVWVWGKQTETSRKGVYGSMGVANNSNAIGSRHSPISWVDARKNRAYIFGGKGNAQQDGVGEAGRLNDVWHFDMTEKEWVWEGGSTNTEQQGDYGSMGVASALNTPSARLSGVSWVDPIMNRAYVFSGFFYDGSEASQSNDLWAAELSPYEETTVTMLMQVSTLDGEKPADMTAADWTPRLQRGLNAGLRDRLDLGNTTEDRLIVEKVLFLRVQLKGGETIDDAATLPSTQGGIIVTASVRAVTTESHRFAQVLLREAEAAQLKNCLDPELQSLEMKFHRRLSSNRVEVLQTSELPIVYDEDDGHSSRSSAGNGDTAGEGSSSSTLSVVLCVLSMTICAAVAIIVVRRARHLRSQEPHDESSPEIDFALLELGQLIGRGGQGRVFEGTFSGLAVAMKRTPRTNNDSKNTKKTLRREMVTLSQLRHPHVVIFYGYADAPDGDLLLVLELASSTLAALLPLIATDNDQHAAETVRFIAASQIAQAMAFIQSKNILHRDLCPSNVLSMHKHPHPSNLLLKIADFGVSRRAGSEVFTDAKSSSPQQQPPQMTVGLMHSCYTAPELIQGDGRYTSAVDVYAYAHVLRSLWDPRGRTEDEALEGKSAAEVARMICTDQYRPPIGPTCPAEVSELITKGWAESPPTRPTFAQICKDIGAAARKNTGVAIEQRAAV